MKGVRESANYQLLTTTQIHNPQCSQLTPAKQLHMNITTL